MGLSLRLTSTLVREHSTAWLAQGIAQGPPTPLPEFILRYSFSPESLHPESLLPQKQQPGNKEFGISPYRCTENGQGRPWALPLPTAFPFGCQLSTLHSSVAGSSGCAGPSGVSPTSWGHRLPGLAWPGCQRTAKCVTLPWNGTHTLHSTLPSMPGRMASVWASGLSHFSVQHTVKSQRTYHLAH